MIKHNVKWIYLLRTYEVDCSVTYKIGLTKNDPAKRIKQLQTGNKEQIELIHAFRSNYGTRLEANLKNLYKPYLIRGEWYDLPQRFVNSFLETCEKQEKNLSILAETNTYLQDKKI